MVVLVDVSFLCLVPVHPLKLFELSTKEVVLSDIFNRRVTDSGFAIIYNEIALRPIEHKHDFYAFKLFVARRSLPEKFSGSFKSFAIDGMKFTRGQYLNGMTRLEELGVLSRDYRGRNNWDFSWDEAPLLTLLNLPAKTNKSEYKVLTAADVVGLGKSTEYQEG